MQLLPNGAQEATSADEACTALEWTDALVRFLDAVPGFKDSTILTIVLTPPSQGDLVIPLPVSLPQGQAELSVSIGKEENFSSGSGSKLQRPLQSYQFSGVERVNIDESKPAVVVHRCVGIIR